MLKLVLDMKYKQIDLGRLKTYSIKERTSKVSAEKSALPHKKGNSFGEFIKRLPDFLASQDLKAVVQAIVMAHKNKRPVILGMGAHSIKVGLSPLIINLMQKGVITAIATNGACIIHDFEIAYIGHTSEDVARELCTGTFGMAKETGQMLNNAINNGVKKGHGIGHSIGEFIDSSDFAFKDKSIFRAAYTLNIPATVHVAVGSDIIHMHPEADGASIGEGSLGDFRLFTSIVADLEGGVYINLGSAVVLPEVFLKALTIARNLGNKVEEFTTVNMDFIQHYRPRENVLKRPTMMKGQCFALTGHHEIMFPLLAAMIVEEL
jgi:deoxyhypusine synthase